MWHSLWVHILELTGSQNSASRSYNFWSGFGSDIGEVAIIGGLVTMVRQHNCHTKGCWRFGRHTVANGLYKVCRHHHPLLAGKVLTESLIRRHHKTVKQPTP